MTQLAVRLWPMVLEHFLGQLFSAAGMPAADASYSAQALVQTDLWGIESHGVLRVPIYLQRLRAGVVNPRPEIRQTAGAGAFAVLDADNALGFVAGRAGMERAMELAREHTLGAAGVVNSNHFGAACLFSRLASDAGMIGIAMTNVAPNMVMPGATRPVVGNNPFSIAAPTFDEFPFAFDIALSHVAGGKLLLAREKGEPIPADWATDKEGRPTTDPAVAFAGYLLPLGLHKGYGLALAIDLLSGMLTGGHFLSGVRNMHKEPDQPSLTSHLMIAIDPLAIMDEEEYRQRMGDFVAEVKATPMVDTGEELLLPGELEYRRSMERSREGLLLPGKLFTDLVLLGRELGLAEELCPAG